MAAPQHGQWKETHLSARAAPLTAPSTHHRGDGCRVPPKRPHGCRNPGALVSIRRRPAAGLRSAAVHRAPRLARRRQRRNGRTVKRRRPVVVARIDLYGGSSVAVRLEPCPGRWPDSETLDRLSFPVCFVAATLRSTSRTLVPRVRHQMMRLATGLVEPPPAADAGESWAERVAGRRFVARTDPGQPGVTARLLEARDGLVAQIKGAPTVLALTSATAALAAAALVKTGVDVHLSAALAIEGVLMWFSQPEARRSSAQRATVEGFRYALRRFEDADRPAPPALRLAIAGHREMRA
jgi:hypothetical protein